MVRSFGNGAALAAALFALSGCGITARSGPTAGAILSPDSPTVPYELVELSPSTLRPFALSPRRAPAPGATIPSTNLALAAGDILRVVIFERSDGGLFSAMTAGGSIFPGVRVSEAGTISLPYAGTLRVAGYDLARVENAIRGALDGKAADPQVHVELVANPSHAVLVAGEVKTPGRVTTLEGPLSVLEAITRAGGPSMPTHAVDVLIRSGGTVTQMPYLQMASRSPIFLKRGDEVIVEANQTRFLAMGAVLRPGAINITSLRLSLLDGVGLAGGLSDQAASPSGVFVFRLQERNSNVEPLVVHVDFSKPEGFFLARQFALLPDDAIYVTNSPVYEVQKFISPIISTLVIGRSTTALTGM